MESRRKFFLRSGRGLCAAFGTAYRGCDWDGVLLYEDVWAGVSDRRGQIGYQPALASVAQDVGQIA